MGDEIGQQREWNHDGEVDWAALDDPLHAGLQRLVADLNHIYRGEKPLYEGDSQPWGFEWVIGDAASDNVFAYVRKDSAGEAMLVVLNMTSLEREDYRIGVPTTGYWAERLNSDAGIYGGGNIGNGGGVTADVTPSHGQAASVRLRLPPLGALILQKQA